MNDAKVESMKTARQFGYDFWDGDRRYGYGGYKYDGRWEVGARQLIDTYDLANKAQILEV